jgi:hypothetical protein
MTVTIYVEERDVFSPALLAENATDVNAASGNIIKYSINKLTPNQSPINVDGNMFRLLTERGILRKIEIL